MSNSSNIYDEPPKKVRVKGRRRSKPNSHLFAIKWFSISLGLHRAGCDQHRWLRLVAGLLFRLRARRLAQAKAAPDTWTELQPLPGPLKVDHE